MTFKQKAPTLKRLAAQGRRIFLRFTALVFQTCLMSSLLLWGQSLNPGLATAQELIQRGSFDEAIPVCLKEIQGHSGSTDAYVLLGIAYAGLERNQDAISALRRAIQLRPSSLPAHTNLGIVYMQSQQTEAAIAELQKAVELGDHEWGTLYNLALCYQATGRSRQAKPLLIEVVSLVPDRSEPRLTLGSVEFDLGEREAASSELKKAEAGAPADIALRKKVGTLFMKHGALDGAAEALEPVVRDDPADSATRLQLAEAYLPLKRYQDVLKVLAFPPEPQWDNQSAATARYLSGAAHAALEDWLSAIDDWRKAVKLDPQPVYYAELVKILLRQGVMGDALLYGRAGVEKFPDSVDTLRALATAAVLNASKEDAVPVLKSLIRLNPEDQEAYIQLANLYMYGGEISTAQDMFSDMRQRFPNSEEPYFGLALVQLRQGGPSQAQAKGYLEEVLRINRNHAGALYYYGKILYREGHFAQALDYSLRSAVLLPPDSPNLVALHFQMGQCYLRLGQKTKAQEEFDAQKKLLDELEGRDRSLENKVLLLDQIEGKWSGP